MAVQEFTVRKKENGIRVQVACNLQCARWHCSTIGAYLISQPVDGCLFVGWRCLSHDCFVVVDEHG